jgi:hypothetical protein
MQVPKCKPNTWGVTIPAVANVPVGPVVNTDNGNFELCTSLITMVQANQFSGLSSEDANVHLQHFLELCDTIVIKDVHTGEHQAPLVSLLPLGEGKIVVLQGMGS